MQTTRILAGLLLLSTLSFAQTNPPLLRNQVRVGAGLIFFGSGDIVGIGYRNEYEYLLRKRVSVAGSLNFGQGATELTSGLVGQGPVSYRRIKNIITLDATANFALVDSRFFKLKVGGGFSLKRQTDNDPSFVGFRNEPRVGTIVDYRYQGDMRSLALGWTVPLSAEFYAGRWSFQARPSIHSFNDGEINTSATIGLGYRF